MNWWISAFYNWLFEVRYFWFTLFILFISSLFILVIPEATEQRIRITGLILQLFGLSTVGFVIRKTRQLFGYPGFLETAIKWLRRFPIRRRVITAQGDLRVPMPDVRSSGYNWTTPLDNSVDERLRALEVNLKTVNQRVTQLENQNYQNSTNFQHLMQSEKITRQNQDQEIRRTIKLAETGGLTISLMGLVWLTFGIIMSTIPNEIADFHNKYFFFLKEKILIHFY